MYSHICHVSARNLPYAGEPMLVQDAMTCESPVGLSMNEIDNDKLDEAKVWMGLSEPSAEFPQHNAVPQKSRSEPET